MYYVWTMLIILAVALYISCGVAVWCGVLLSTTRFTLRKLILLVLFLPITAVCVVLALIVSIVIVFYDLAGGNK